MLQQENTATEQDITQQIEDTKTTNVVAFSKFDGLLTPEEKQQVTETVTNSPELKLKLAIEQAKTTYDTVKLFMASSGWKMKPDGMTVETDSHDPECETMVEDEAIKAEYYYWCELHDVSSKFMHSEKYNAAIKKLEADRLRDQRVLIKARLTQPVIPPTEWLKLQQLSKFTDDDILILKSWIWNVKQAANAKSHKMLQVPMPMLFGKGQGLGKSWFCRELYSPVQELAARCSLKQLGDDFFTPNWGKLLVADFDEMAGYEKSDITKFKTWCTEDVLTYRVMRSMNMARVNKTVSPIGSSNKELKEVLWDDTGSRRVWQIDVNEKPRPVDYIQQIDFDKLWLSIDHNDQCPLHTNGNFDRILTVQFDTQRRKANTELFVDDWIINNPEPLFTDHTVFYNQYRMWCADNGEKPVKKSNFDDVIATLSGEKIVKKINGKAARGWKLTALYNTDTDTDENTTPITPTASHDVSGVIF